MVLSYYLTFDKNDKWVIRDIDKYPENSVKIYNSWGDLINSFKNYDNKNAVWKGNRE
ncbi:MAG: gliding motility-associated C-terminal domain-containing protein, partial [Flavobacteriales bacterium]